MAWPVTTYTVYGFETLKFKKEDERHIKALEMKGLRNGHKRKEMSGFWRNLE